MLIILHDKQNGCWLKFDNPVRIISTDKIHEITACLQAIDEMVTRDKLFAAGFISYEAAPAFDEAFVVHKAGGEGLPLLCFGLFSSVETIQPGELGNKFRASAQSDDKWIPSVSIEDYCCAVEKIKEYIAAGETYQVNLTTRLHSHFTEDPQSVFLDLTRDQSAGYAAFVDIGSHSICSFSPELFFQYDDGLLTSKPMKGTIARGRTILEDKELAQQLKDSEKNQAENVMIVDMIRNDMGRVAKPGSVMVKRLFELEKYPYIWQMTSTVQSRVDWSLIKILQALYPCASITGAPKIRAMQIIKEVEASPRGIYTGSIGYITPALKAQFNVAIRTISVDKTSRFAEYGVGSGIVWDSNKRDEYGECLAKAGVLYQKTQPFRLLESLLWEPSNGYYLLEEHLTRLSESADYFDFSIDANKIRKYLCHAVAEPSDGAVKIRLLLDRHGQIEVAAESLAKAASNDLRVCLALEAVDSSNIFLFHKTTERSIYDKACKDSPGFDDVILWNEKKEITESCRSNIVVQLHGQWITPVISCGLLPGTFRQMLLTTGQITEGIITLSQLKQAQQIYCINSVRRWMKVTSVEET